VNRSAARKAAEVAALRRARQAAHEAAVTEAVGVYFDRSGNAAKVRAEARERAEAILADGERTARVLDRLADAALVTLKRLGEPVLEIAAMVDLPVSGVRAALGRSQPRDADVECMSGEQAAELQPSAASPADGLSTGDPESTGVVRT
jgi:hypothetical protein